jgi:hypothetical protein
MLQHALDHEHHVRTAGIVFVEDDRGRIAERPGQDALLELGHLLAAAQLDRVLPDQVDPADVAVEVHAHAGPVEPRRDLFDMGRLAGAVIALDHHAAVVGEARKDRQRRVGVELVGRVDLGHAVGALGEALHHHVGVDPEDLADRDVLGRFRARRRSCRRPSCVLPFTRWACRAVVQHIPARARGRVSRPIGRRPSSRSVRFRPATMGG